MLEGRSEVDWAEVVAFLEQQKPGLADGIVGATAAELEQLQKRSPVPLPEAYVGFMRAFGGARAGFNAMPEHCYLAAELLTVPESMHTWDRRRYLMVGLRDAISHTDRDELFLDLSHADDRDALMVGFTPCEQQPAPYLLECGISDCVIFRAMWWFAMERSPVRAGLMHGVHHERDKQWAWDRVRGSVDVLEKLGFMRCLPQTPYTWCAVRGELEYCVVKAESEDDAVFVEVGGAEDRVVSQMVAVLEDTTGAELRSTTRLDD